MPPTLERRASDVPAATVNFILNLGRALHACGYAAHRLEGVLGAAAERLGIEAQFSSTPTLLHVAFGTQDRQQTFFLRVQPGEQDLGKLSQLDRVVLRVLRGEITPEQGSGEIATLAAAPPRYGRLATTLAYGLGSGAATRFLGGGLPEIIVGTALGLIIGLLALASQRRPWLSRVFEPFASFVAAFLAAGAGALTGSFSVFTATLAGLIVLVPGLTLTVGMTELTTRHLVSGTARLSAAFMTLMGITFGVALGNSVAAMIFGEAPFVSSAPIPSWVNIVALLIAPLGFTVLLKAERSDFPLIVLIGVLAFYGSRVGAELFGPELGSFVGAFAVGLAGNIFARVYDRPSQLLQVPGILLLVPGSVGFRSLNALMEREVVSGIETAFRMLVIAVSLAAGLLLSSSIAPRRDLP